MFHLRSYLGYLWRQSEDLIHKNLHKHTHLSVSLGNLGPPEDQLFSFHFFSVLFCLGYNWTISQPSALLLTRVFRPKPGTNFVCERHDPNPQTLLTNLSGTLYCHLSIGIFHKCCVDEKVRMENGIHVCASLFVECVHLSCSHTFPPLSQWYLVVKSSTDERLINISSPEVLVSAALPGWL